MESNQYKAFGVKDYAYKERPHATGYIGKENDGESNLGDHGVRKYDSDLGRFLCPDAMWEKYISYTPYQYSLNNPISNIDWDGNVVQGGVAVAAGGYIGVAVGFGIATWAISEIQNPGSTAGLGRVLETSFSNAVSDVKGLFSTPDYSVKGNVSIYPAQDATNVVVNLMNAEQKLDRQMAKQNKKLPSDKIPNNSGKNEEADAILKAALAKEGMNWTKDLKNEFHRIIREFKDPFTGNVPKEVLKREATEFVKSKKN